MKFLFYFICLFSFTISFSQNNLEEVVYLKDGSSIRGTIIEQVPNQTLKIQTKDGSVFVYKFIDVGKITKEKVFVSPYYSNNNTNLEANMRQYKSSGIGLTTTGGILFLSGSLSFAGGRGNGYRGPGSFIAGTTLLCLSVPFIISGPIMLSKYKRAKNELQNQKGLSFAPSIKVHNLDGISNNATNTVTSYGAAIKFNF